MNIDTRHKKWSAYFSGIKANMLFKEYIQKSYFNIASDIENRDKLFHK